MKKLRALFLLLCTAIFLAGCGAQTLPDAGTAESAQAITFTDSLGNTVTIQGTDRVIAASGSFAETWLLAGGTLTGTTSDAFTLDFSLPETVTDIGSLHNPSAETILACNPQLVIFSAEISGQMALSDQLTAAGIPVAYFRVEEFDDYLKMLDICTDLTGRKDLYQTNGLEIEAQIAEILARPRTTPAPRVLLLRAGTGKVTARNSDTMAGKMLQDLGAVNLADSETSLLDTLSMEVILREEPDYIFVTTMGDSEEKAQAALQETLLSNPAWAQLGAVQAGNYITLPKDLFHQKPNQHWAQAYAQLWEILYD